MAGAMRLFSADDVHRHAFFFQEAPHGHEPAGDGRDVLFRELLEEGGHYAPTHDVPCLDEALDAWIGGGDVAEGIGVEGDDLHGQGEEKIPIGVAAQVDAPGTVDPVKKPDQIGFRFHIVIAAHGAEDELQSRVVEPDKGPAVFCRKLGALHIHLFLNEREDELSHLVVVGEGFACLVGDFEDEAHRAYHLPPDRLVGREVEREETAIDHGKVGRDTKEVGRRFLLEIRGQLVHEPPALHVYAPVLLIDDDPRKMLHGLDIHVLVEREPRKLGPKRDIEPEGRYRGPGRETHGA